MFGIADWMYASRKLRKGYVEPELNWGPEIVHHNGKEISWFCFVPRSVSEMPLLRKGIIPKEGKVFVYALSSLNLIKPNPEETVDRLQEIYNDAIRRMNEELAKGYSLSMFGVSLGNVLSIRAAGSINSKIEKLVSIVGGGRLGISAWYGILTRDTAKQSGCSSSEEYEKRLSIFSPIHYIDGIVADEISIRLGTKDLLIPFKYGKELAYALIERGKKTGSKVDYKSYMGADHCAALVLSALSKI
ncbi:MAG: hypothetical protein Q7J54_06860 [Candidatus Woesearchaeota archaeon]|nr:hypothetical protein [Candidatus Woesearchaeota archaeon]